MILGIDNTGRSLRRIQRQSGTENAGIQFVIVQLCAVFRGGNSNGSVILRKIELLIPAGTGQQKLRISILPAEHQQGLITVGQYGKISGIAGIQQGILPEISCIKTPVCRKQQLAGFSAVQDGAFQNPAVHVQTGQFLGIIGHLFQSTTDAAVQIPGYHRPVGAVIQNMIGDRKERFSGKSVGCFDTAGFL